MDRLALFFIIFGALNWGLIGFFQIDLSTAFFGETDSIICRIVYTIVGLAGVYGIKFFFDHKESEKTE